MTCTGAVKLSHYCKWAPCQVSVDTLCIPFLEFICSNSTARSFGKTILLTIYFFQDSLSTRKITPCVVMENRIHLMTKSDIFIPLHINQSNAIKYWSRCIHRPKLNNHKISNHMACITAKKGLDLRTRNTFKNDRKQLSSSSLSRLCRVGALITLIFVINIEREKSSCQGASDCSEKCKGYN